MCLDKILERENLPQSITGYKIVYEHTPGFYTGLFRGSESYKLGQTVLNHLRISIMATDRTQIYDSGFHAYVTKRAIYRNVGYYFSGHPIPHIIRGCRIIKVRLSDLTAKGTESGYTVYVGQKMEILDDITDEITRHMREI